MKNLPLATPTNRAFLEDETQSRKLLARFDYDTLKAQNDRVCWIQSRQAGPFLTIFIGSGLLALGVEGCRRIVRQPGSASSFPGAIPSSKDRS
jgi:hypothetical protein